MLFKVDTTGNRKPRCPYPPQASRHVNWQPAGCAVPSPPAAAGRAAASGDACFLPRLMIQFESADALGSEPSAYLIPQSSSQALLEGAIPEGHDRLCPLPSAGSKLFTGPFQLLRTTTGENRTFQQLYSRSVSTSNVRAHHLTVGEPRGAAREPSSALRASGSCSAAAPFEVREMRPGDGWASDEDGSSDDGGDGTAAGGLPAGPSAVAVKAGGSKLTFVTPFAPRAADSLFVPSRHATTGVRCAAACPFLPATSIETLSAACLLYCVDSFRDDAVVRRLTQHT